MARYIELSVSWIIRGDDPDGTVNFGESRGMGTLRWDADDPGKPPVELAGVDALTVELMRSYVEIHDERLAAWKKKVVAAKQVASDGPDLRHAMGQV